MPLAATSCSVPAWIRLWSVTTQPESMQPPPIPTQVAENSSSPPRCWVAVGTVQVPEIWLKLVPFSSSPWL